MDSVHTSKDAYTESADAKVVAKESVRFDLSQPGQTEAMLKYLDDFGYVVICNAADTERIEASKNEFWNFWEETKYRGPINREAVETYKNWMGNAANGILVGARGANHNDFSWNSRTLPVVKEAFAKVWQDEDLVVSFDASGAFRPYQHNMSWLTNGGWWHVDQNCTRGPHREGKVTIQGLVTYYDATAETGGLCVIPGSHKHHTELCARAPTAKMKFDFVQVPRDDPILTSAQAVLVCAKAGDLILWDSRTVHCNTPALHLVNYYQDKLKESELNRQNLAHTSVPGSEGSSSPFTESVSTQETHTATPGTATATTNNNTTNTTNTTSSTNPATHGLIRLVSYVCMVPRAHCSAEVLRARKQAFVHRHGTSHFPAIESIHVMPSEYKAVWSQRRDILQLVGYSDSEIDNIQTGREPEGNSCVIC